jgi:lysine 2,3-aminomutase
MGEAGRAAFRRRYFPGASAREWNDWQWQMAHSLRDLRGLERVFVLSDDERLAVARLRKGLPIMITPYYAGLMDRGNPADPLRRTMIPVRAEFVRGPGERDDPLGEERHTPVEGIVHTYPSKALFLVTDHCATYCRYCTRARVVGSGELAPDPGRWDAGLRYIEQHTEIRDVLLSGGDPLTLSDARLDRLLGRLRAIKHIEIVRIGTKLPAVLPQRITPALARVLRRHHPLWISVHFTHPAELTPEATRACERLVDAGIPLANQTVLLAGVNNDAGTMQRLFEGLLRLRVKPYYLHQCDAVTGSAQFRTPVQEGIDLIRALHGNTTGYAVPTLMLDAPGGGGKVPLSPDYIAGREGDDLLLRNYKGDVYRYHDA